MSHILGISAYYHDSAAALMRGEEILAAVQEERFSRIKHDASFPKAAIQYCLQEANISADALQAVVFYDKPFLKFERLLDSYLHYTPRGLSSFLKAIPVWIKEKIWIKSLIEEQLPGFKGEILFTRHHQAHAASAFYPSPFQKAVIITADGVGEWTTTSICVGFENTLKMIKEIRFPHSLGLLYSAFTYYCGFKVNSGEYKVMGLAPYGYPKYKEIIYKHLLDVKEDGSFSMDMRYFNYPVGLTMVNKRFEKLFGFPPRKPEAPLTQEYMDLAASIQEITNDIMVKIARYAKKLTGYDTICLAGGVALNCVANSRIQKEGGFSNIWIQPAAGDAGGALGAALSAYYDYYKNPRRHVYTDSQKGSLLGPAYSDEEIESFLKRYDILYHKKNVDEILSKTAHCLTEQKVVGWFQGRMEFGPRALGNRSILADPRSATMQKQLNLKIKYRESFRPFAPSVLEEHASDFFHILSPSPYMLLTADVHKNIRYPVSDIPHQGLEKLNIQRSLIPAVTHVDYSARLQTVNKSTNPLFYRLISEFYKLTGCPLVVNTSFNIRGEPIVNTPSDALTCFMNTEMDVLVMGTFMIFKEEQTHLNKYDWIKKYTKD
ncbi:MAG: carbamoyltransferase [Candidatus Marinimicrobia bacterium]|nr:carbamoyltransferase [Candidatus Neomarinimicrobiota bacterium]